MSSRKYYEEINIARGIAILLVVMGHGLSDIYNGTYTVDWCSNIARYFFVLIYSFHMPLFIFLSGFCNAEVYQRKGNPFGYIKKRFCRLMIPYLAWGIIYVFLDLLVGNYTWTEFSLKKYLIELLVYGDNANWQLWTLYTLFLCCLLSYLLLDVLHLPLKLVVIGAGLISTTYLIVSMFIILPNFLYYTNVFSVLIFYFFFVSGILIREDNVLERKFYSPMILSIGALLLLCANAYIVTFLAVENGVGTDWSKIIGSIPGILLLIIISRKVLSLRMKKVWNYLGAYSMSIYLLANICQNFIRIPVRKHWIPQEYLVGWLILSVAAGILIPIIADKKIISRFRSMSFLLLGKG